MLRRFGNKTRLLPKLLPLFPENITTFIDMFMGSGAVTFAMVDRAKYIIANDKDEEVFNLFMAVKEHKDELIESIKTMPAHEKLFQYWRKQQEHDCVWRATRFLMLSNFGYLGKSETFKLNIPTDDKKVLLRKIQDTYLRNTIRFMCCDFREILNKVTFKNFDFGKPATHKEEAFAYADPPYTATQGNYDAFTEQDTRDLFEMLVNSGLRFAISEFENVFVLNLAEKYGLHVTEIGERQNLKNRRTEILITNYEPVQKQPSLFHGLSLN